MVFALLSLQVPLQQLLEWIDMPVDFVKIDAQVPANALSLTTSTHAARTRPSAHAACATVHFGCSCDCWLTPSNLGPCAARYRVWTSTLRAAAAYGCVACSA